MMTHEARTHRHNQREREREREREKDEVMRVNQQMRPQSAPDQGAHVVLNQLSQSDSQ